MPPGSASSTFDQSRFTGEPLSLLAAAAAVDHR